jgi:hypothetical protein
MVTQDLIGKCSDKIRRLAEDVARTKVESSMTITLTPDDFLTTLPDEKLEPLIVWSKSDSGCKFIYMFTAVGGKSPEELQRLYQTAKQEEKDRNGKRMFARNIHPSKTLYVGSSKSIGSRISQHLGHKNETVYSMQLRHWLKHDSIAQLKIEVWKFSSQTDQSILQAIEDHLWEMAAPMLGKQGGK